MDACHLLLGRLWQYDMDATYNCRKNTYAIVRDGKTYNFKPLPEPKKEREPLAVIVEEKEGYALILKPRDEPLPSKDK